MHFISFFEILKLAKRLNQEKEEFFMRITPEQVKKVLTNNYTFRQLGFSLLTTRLKGIYMRDSSELTLLNCANEMNAFLGKYEIIMAEDYAFISKL